jgi:hypothetical protein
LRAVTGSYNSKVIDGAFSDLKSGANLNMIKDKFVSGWAQASLKSGWASDGIEMQVK